MLDTSRRNDDPAFLAKIGASDSLLLECILDNGRSTSLVPFAWAILELGSGGRPEAIIREHIQSGSTSSGHAKRRDAFNRIKTFFTDLDQDGDGALSKDEMKAVLKIILRKYDMLISDDEFELMFKAADADNDGKVDLLEFVTWLQGSGN